MFVRVVMSGCIALAAAGSVFAADVYPARPIRIIVAYTLAGTTDFLATETQRILKLPDIAERISGLGAEVVGGTPAQFAAHIKSEIAKWAKVIKDANVELQ